MTLPPCRTRNDNLQPATRNSRPPSLALSPLRARHPRRPPQQELDHPPHPSRLRHPHHPRRLPPLACHQHRRGLLAAGEPPAQRCPHRPHRLLRGCGPNRLRPALAYWPQLSLTSVALALILGGALGNLYDRIRLHHVVDFLAVRIYHYNWPDFNVADSCIVIGACLLLLEIFRPTPKDS